MDVVIVEHDDDDHDTEQDEVGNPVDHGRLHEEVDEGDGGDAKKDGEEDRIDDAKVGLLGEGTKNAA